MDTKEIQDRVDSITKAMTAKGLREAAVQFWVKSHEGEFTVYLRWKDVTKPGPSYYDNESHFVRAEAPEGALREAEDFVATLPSAEEARMKQFMGALANVIDLGRSNGIEVEFINPLQVTMKKLSEQIITDQRAA